MLSTSAGIRSVASEQGETKGGKVEEEIGAPKRDGDM